MIEYFGLTASGAQRVAQMTTLTDGKLLGQDDSDLFQNVGTGAATYSNNKVNLTVSPGQYMIRQTTRFNPYFSGKSQLVEMTFDNFHSQEGITKRIGYFSSNASGAYDTNFDGFFIENNGQKITLQCWRKGTKTIDFDFSIMDNADSLIGHNWKNFNVVAFDFLWLGGAVLRFFVKTNNGFELIHTVNYSSNYEDVFILSPNQPIRYEIRSSTGSGSLRYVCSQVATEGSINEAGKTLSIINLLPLATNSTGVIYALKGIKKQAAFREVGIQIIDIELVLSATSDAGILMLLKNPTISSALTYVNKEKIQEGTATNQTITSGTGRLICAINVSSVGGSSQVMKENFLSFLSSKIDNTTDEFVLAYMPSTTNQNVQGIITIKEF